MRSKGDNKEKMTLSFFTPKNGNILCVIIKYLLMLLVLNVLVAFTAIGQDYTKVLVGTDSVFVYSYIPTYAMHTDFVDWREIYWNEKVPDGNYVIFYDDSVTVAQIGRFQNNKKQGLFRYYNWYGNKQSEATYLDGKILVNSSFGINGKLSFQSSYSNNKQIYQSWYDTGIPKSYISDKRKMYFFPNGRMKLNKSYINGKLDGVVILFNEKGQILFRGNWKAGKPEGKLVYGNGKKIN